MEIEFDSCSLENLIQSLQNCSWVTTTTLINDKAPIEYAIPLYGYVIPALVVITMITNTFIVVVLSQKHLRTPTNMILLAMAVTELITGLSSAPWLLFYYTFGGHAYVDEFGMPKFWCHTQQILMENIPTVFHTAAIWLTVFLAVNRYIYVCVPTLSRKWCTMEKTRWIICLLCSTALVVELPKALSTYCIPLKNSHLNLLIINNI